MQLVRVMTLAAGAALLLLGLARPAASAGTIVHLVDLTPAAAGARPGGAPADVPGQGPGKVRE